MFQADLFTDPAPHSREASRERAQRPPDLPDILARLAAISERPRHAFMVLNLIAKAAGSTGRAGPFLKIDGKAVPVREWLCDAMSPMAQRDPRRIARAAAVRTELEAAGRLPDDPHAADRLIEDEVRARVRRTGLTHISRAVSDLVRAGLLRRHYQGYAVDHENRGGQRHAVYTLLPSTRRALAGAAEDPSRSPKR